VDAAVVRMESAAKMRGNDIARGKCLVTS
jgi:hypothetical protein